MSKWSLSLTDLANQAEAFLEQVDKKAAQSLHEDEEESGKDFLVVHYDFISTSLLNYFKLAPVSEHDDQEENFFSNLSNTVSLLPEASNPTRKL